VSEPTTDFFMETPTDLEKCHTVTTLVYNASIKNRIRICIFFTKLAETDRLQDFENRNNTRVGTVVAMAGVAGAWFLPTLRKYNIQKK